MQVQRTNNISFKDFRVDVKGKKALSNLLEGATEEAKPEVIKFFQNLRLQMNENAGTLFKNKKARGTDIVLTTMATDATGWQDVPALIFKKKNRKTSEPILLTELVPPRMPQRFFYDDITKIAKSTLERTDKWFHTSFQNILFETPKEQKLNKTIIDEIFG